MDLPTTLALRATCKTLLPILSMSRECSIKDPVNPIVVTVMNNLRRLCVHTSPFNYSLVTSSHLVSLHIHNPWIKRDSGLADAHLMTMTALQELWLDKSRGVTDASLSLLTNLRELKLDLDDTKAKGLFLTQLSQLTRLHAYSLPTGITLSMVSHMTNLEHLRLSDSQGGVDKICHLPLRTLHLRYPFEFRLIDKPLSHLKQLDIISYNFKYQCTKYLPSIESICLDRCTVDPMDLSSATQLTQLRLIECTFTHDTIYLSVLTNLYKLEMTRVTDAIIWNMTRLIQLSSLTTDWTRRSDLLGPGIADKAIRDLNCGPQQDIHPAAIASQIHLTKLLLSTVSTMRDGDLKVLTNLTILALGESKEITDAGVSSLVNLKCLYIEKAHKLTDACLSNMSLKVLGCGSTQGITDKGLATQTALQDLYLMTNKSITTEGILSLPLLRHLETDLNPNIDDRVLQHKTLAYIRIGKRCNMSPNGYKQQKRIMVYDDRRNR